MARVCLDLAVQHIPVQSRLRIDPPQSAAVKRRRVCIGRDGELTSRWSAAPAANECVREDFTSRPRRPAAVVRRSVTAGDRCTPLGPLVGRSVSGGHRSVTLPCSAATTPRLSSASTSSSVISTRFTDHHGLTDLPPPLPRAGHGTSRGHKCALLCDWSCNGEQ